MIKDFLMHLDTLKNYKFLVLGLKEKELEVIPTLNIC